MADNGALRMACRLGHLAAAKNLIAQGADKNSAEPGKPHMTPLYIACIQGEWEIAEYLLDIGAKVPPPNANGVGTTVFQEIIDKITHERDGAAVVAKFFMRLHKPDLNIVGKALLLPLEKAIRVGNYELADMMLAQGAEINGVNAGRFQNGWTALMHAVQKKEGAVEAVTYLLGKGADATILDSYGHTAATLAMQNNKWDVFDLLEKNMWAKAISQDQRAAYDLALLTACREGTLKDVQDLIAKGADKNCCQVSQSYMTPIYIACANSRWDVATYLLGLDVVIDPPEDSSFSAFHEALMRFTDQWDGAAETVALFIAKKPALAVSYSMGFMPLNHAVSIGNMRLVELMIDHGAPVNNQTESQFGFGAWTPLMYAADKRTGAAEAVLCLLRRGANPDVINAEGNTAADIASAAGRDDVAETIANYARDMALLKERQRNEGIRSTVFNGTAQPLPVQRMRIAARGPKA